MNRHRPSRKIEYWKSGEFDPEARVELRHLLLQARVRDSVAEGPVLQHLPEYPDAVAAATRDGVEKLPNTSGFHLSVGDQLLERSGDGPPRHHAAEIDEQPIGVGYRKRTDGDMCSGTRSLER